MTVAADTQALHRGLRLAGRYQLAERLERGALATVYRGQDLVLRRPIAVKAVPPEQISAYQESLRASAKLAHPAAICVYDALEQDGWLFIVQEYVSGRPLSAYFSQGVPVERAVDLARQFANALAYAHSHGIVHGDLSPSAVLVDRHATVRLNNFGLPPDAAYFARTGLAVAASLAADDPTVELPASAEAPTTTHLTAAEPSALASPEGDTRAAGYLLWQLLTEPVLDAAGVDPEGGMRRFRGEVPRTLRDVVVATMASSAPQPITDTASLTLTLELLGQELGAGRTGSIAISPPAAVLAARTGAPEPLWSAEDTVQGNRALARTSAAGVRTGGNSAPPLPERFAKAGAAHSGFAPGISAGSERQAPVWSPSSQREPRAERPPAYGARYDLAKDATHRGLSLAVVLLLGAVLFILFFLVGYFSQVSLH